MSPLLGLGTDICYIPRIYRLLASRHGPRFVARILIPAEHQEPRPRALLQCILQPGMRLYDDRPPPLVRPVPRPGPAVTEGAEDETGTRDPALWEAAVFLAGRFAAKEAAIKAHTHRKLTFHSIHVRTMHAPPGMGPADARASSPPIAVIEADKPGRPHTTAMLSISHDGDYATAVCLAMQTREDDDSSSSSRINRTSSSRISTGSTSRISNSDGTGSL